MNIKKMLVAAIALPLMASAQDSQLLVTIKTDVFNNAGEANHITMYVGTQEKTYLDIDFGIGEEEHEVEPASFNPETQAVDATAIGGSVTKDGVVKIYGDPSTVFEYFDITGIYATEIEFTRPENVYILEVSKNNLKKLDLTGFTNLQYFYANQNPFDEAPLKFGKNHPNLQLIDLQLVENLDPGFNFSDYPNLVSADCYGTGGLTRADISACKNLLRLSIDNTDVAELDLSTCPQLQILNISETRIPAVDLSKLPNLTQFYCTHTSATNTDIKLESLDVTHNPSLMYLFCSGNRIKELDLTKNTYLTDIYADHNMLTSLDLSNNKQLFNVYISKNYMDFNTLPIDNLGIWGNYDYEQYPLPVGRSQQVGVGIDLASRVCRLDADGNEITPTTVTVYARSENDPANVYAIDASKYTYDKGVVTFLEAQSDSCYIQYANTAFETYPLKSSLFAVKTAADFGKDDLAVSISTNSTGRIPLYIGMRGASAETPKTVKVNFGDGTLHEFTVTTSEMPEKANVTYDKTKYGAIYIYVPQDETITAFGLDGVEINSIDLSSLKELRDLRLTGTNMYRGINASTPVDLQWNRCLEKLVITGNTLNGGLSLTGANGYYGKNNLSYVDLHDNALTELEITELIRVIRHLDLSDNKFEEFTFKDANNVEYLDMSHNSLSALNLNYMGKLKTLDISYNNISELVLPEPNVIEMFKFNNNAFTFPTLPERNGLDEDHYIYAPQAIVPISTKGPGFDLSNQYVEIDGAVTQYTWKTLAGATLTEGTDYTNDKGVIRFLAPSEGKTIYCEMSHPAYPQFAGAKVMKTSNILSAGFPQNRIATFKTPVGGQTVELSIASKTSGNALYIDWGGNRTLTQYPLATMYTLFTAVTTEGAEVSIYSYDEADNISVYSQNGATVENADFSGMKSLEHLTMGGAGISEITLPSDNHIRELFLEGNNFTSFDFSRVPDLTSVSFSGNKFAELDLTGAPAIERAAFANNEIESVKFAPNSVLDQLYLGGNKIAEFDATNIPNIHTLDLYGNLLSEIDLDGLKKLRVLNLDHNRFDFTTLPLPRSQWTMYTYSNQPVLQIEIVDGKVDLSSQAMVDGTPSEYIWFIGEPVLNYETGTLDGETLYVDEEYTIDNGVTTFLSDIDHVMCVLTNAKFPNFYLYTNFIDATSGIEDVAVDGKPANADVYTLQGVLLIKDATDEQISALPAGFYIIRGVKTLIR